MAPVLALVLVALSLGLSNFAAAIGIGVAGASTRTRVRVGFAFGIFEAGMPVLGLALGRGLATSLGHDAHWAGGGLLLATGAYGLVQGLRPRPEAAGPPLASSRNSAACSSPGPPSASTTSRSASRWAPTTSAFLLPLPSSAR